MSIPGNTVTETVIKVSGQCAGLMKLRKWLKLSWHEAKNFINRTVKGNLGNKNQLFCSTVTWRCTSGAWKPWIPPVPQLDRCPHCIAAHDPWMYLPLESHNVLPEWRNHPVEKDMSDTCCILSQKHIVVDMKMKMQFVCDKKVNPKACKSNDVWFSIWQGIKLATQFTGTLCWMTSMSLSYVQKKIQYLQIHNLPAVAYLGAGFWDLGLQRPAGEESSWKHRLAPQQDCIWMESLLLPGTGSSGDGQPS